MTKTTSPSPDGNSDRCKAIAISTGQRCSRKGKLDGYCSEKHKEQAGGLWGMRRPSQASNASESGDDSSTKKTASKTEGDAYAKKSSKTAKALEITRVVKSAKAEDVASPEPAAAKMKTPATRKTAPRTAKKTVPRKKKVGSSDESESASDDDYEPSDSVEYTDSADSYEHSDDSDDDSDDDEELEELSGKLASVKIKSDDPTLPPRPLKTKDDSSADAHKIKIQHTKSKVFNTNAVLAPPKNKTKSSSASGRPTGGFWVPAPPPVKIPESTIKILAVVKDKLRLDGRSSSTDTSNAVVPAGQQAPEKKESGLFKYHGRVHSYLFASEEDLDPESKRAAVRKFVHDIGSFFHKMKKSSNTDLGLPYKNNKPLPDIPSDDTTKPSQDSVDSIIQDIQDLSVKSEEDEFPNQCHGFNTNGYRCKRKVKLDRPIEKGEVLMCHDHEISEEDEVVVHIEGKGGVLLQWLDVSVWVNPNLPDYVQNKLRKAMERPVSETDKPGYIYSYQLLEFRMTPTHTLFKVGRTDNVHRRMNEWSDKCGSPPILIEVFPEQGALAPKTEDDLSENAAATAADNEITGLRCRYSHRVERLIHIELKPFHDKDHVCACKTAHREWFKVPHQSGLNDKEQFNQAWEQIRRVCVHWMAYMERVYGPG
ncbi:hypothetical protein BGX28_001168 [Mortierella sp. GBA30]|nr:hypothetical protein BGX28_001168 [Mortierella sp. GBA30]